MEEIKVGEYCKLARSQGIRKIEEIDEEGYWLDDYIADEFGEATLYLYKSELKNEVENHSENIIDLIEEDDIGIMRYNGLIFKKFITKDDILELKFKNYELLEIVTKEQFNQVKYEV